MSRPLWYTILLAVRRIADEDFTSTDLAEEVGLDVASASAWLSKFERWGYVRKAGKAAAGRRWCWTWGLTTYGETRKAPTRANQIRGEKQAERTLRIAANPSQTRGKTEK